MNLIACCITIQEYVDSHIIAAVAGPTVTHTHQRGRAERDGVSSQLTAWLPTFWRTILRQRKEKTGHTYGEGLCAQLGELHKAAYALPTILTNKSRLSEGARVLSAPSAAVRSGGGAPLRDPPPV